MLDSIVLRRTTLIALIAILSLGPLFFHPAFSETPKAPELISPEKPAAPREGVVGTWLLGSSRGQTWVLVVAIVVALVGFGLNQVGAWFGRRRDRKDRTEALLVAFKGEIHIIKTILGKTARVAFKEWEENTSLVTTYNTPYPKSVFKVNAGRLGDIQNAKLVEYLVGLYAMLEVWEEAGRLIEGGDHTSGGTIDYLYMLIACFNGSVHLDAHLSIYTRRLKDRRDWAVKYSDEDKSEIEFCENAQERLVEAKMSLEEHGSG